MTLLHSQYYIQLSTNATGDQPTTNMNFHKTVKSNQQMGGFVCIFLYAIYRPNKAYKRFDCFINFSTIFFLLGLTAHTN